MNHPSRLNTLSNCSNHSKFEGFKVLQENHESFWYILGRQKDAFWVRYLHQVNEQHEPAEPPQQTAENSSSSSFAGATDSPCAT